LNGLQLPPALHIALTIRHAKEGFAEHFLTDLKESVAYVKANPSMEGSMGPVYGLAGNIYTKGAVQDFLKGLLDTIFEV
jgi:hypothetical protein